MEINPPLKVLVWRFLFGWVNMDRWPIRLDDMVAPHSILGLAIEIPWTQNLKIQPKPGHAKAFAWTVSPVRLARFMMCKIEPNSRFVSGQKTFVSGVWWLIPNGCRCINQINLFHCIPSSKLRLSSLSLNSSKLNNACIMLTLHVDNQIADIWDSKL